MMRSNSKPQIVHTHSGDRIDMMDKCSYADKYKAERKPTCGCFVCETKWTISQLIKEVDSLKKQVEANKDVLMREGIYYLINT
jgi:hypothetical protein